MSVAPSGFSHRRRRMRRRRVALIGALIIAATASYVFLPRDPDLRRFAPTAMAHAETLMWRHYYEKRYAALFADLYDVAREQYGFSPWDSLRIAFYAARAAQAFQPSTSRAEADAARPYLESYFGVLARAAAQPVDVAATASTELDWWQARREDRGPDEYGVTVARVSSLLYGVDNAATRSAGIVRAEAMAYRDAHASAMTDADWTIIDHQLNDAYGLLKTAIAPPSSR